MLRCIIIFQTSTKSSSVAFSTGQNIPKKNKAGALPEKQKLIFEALEASRSDKHNVGRRKKILKETMKKQDK